MMEEVERTELEYREGTSDKVYIAILFKQGDGYRVKFSYGKRWNVNNHSHEPETEVSYGEAHAIYQKKIDQKLKKGYRHQ